MANPTNINKKSMLPTGAILHGNYRIDSYLSSGGFGNTYVATHTLFDEVYAVKEFFMKDVSERNADSSVKVSNPGKVDEFKGQLEKFRKEALRLRKLHNPHIVRVYDLFNENGTAYYVMDFIDGENLKERLKRTGKPMTEDEVRSVLTQVLDALQEVHGSGLWHMDLKPANIMMDKAGTVKLIDFGASKQFDADKGGAVSTSAVTYTNGYAPREQMEKRYDKFGPWTDFYALGATLYNLLTLKHPPMPGDIDDDKTPDKHEALPLPKDVSQSLRDLVLWLMSTSRLQRPQSVQQIRAYLEPPRQSEKPVITYDPLTLTLDAKAPGTLSVLVDGKPVQVPYTFTPQESEATHTITATAQEQDCLTSEEDRLRVVIPGMVIVEPYNPPVDETTHLYDDNESADDDEPRSGMSGNLKAIILAACAGLLLVVGGYFLLNQGGGDDEGDQAEQEQVEAVDEVPAEQVQEVQPTEEVKKEEERAAAVTGPKTVNDERMTIALGRCRYTGPVDADGKPDGRGTAMFGNGDKVTADFTHGDITSKDATYTFAASGDKFKGSMKKNALFEGTYTCADGRYFIGTFKNNRPVQGQWYNKDGTKIK